VPAVQNKIQLSQKRFATTRSRRPTPGKVFFHLMTLTVAHSALFARIEGGKGEESRFNDFSFSIPCAVDHRCE